LPAVLTAVCARVLQEVDQLQQDMIWRAPCTAREYSTGERRRLGRISKRGDVYVRSLLVNGRPHLSDRDSSDLVLNRSLALTQFLPACFAW
jgi:hypothetical protein